MRTNALKPNPRNPRTITEKKLQALHRSMLEFGDISGIVFNRRTGNLCGGHQRGKNLPEDAEVTITKSYKKPTKTGTVAVGFILLDGEMWNYREVDWSPAKEKAAMLAANKNAGDWDLPGVSEIMKDLSSFDVDFDLDLTMFDKDERLQFDTITVREHERAKNGEDEDEDPEPPEEPEKLTGQVQLFNGDCVETMKLIGKNSIDACVTDPPAGISFMGKSWDDDKGGRDAWIKWLTEVMQQVLRVLKPGGHAFVWALPRTSHWTATALENAGFEIRDVVTHLFGSGFPKSLDVSKAIDRAAGVEHEKVGTRKVLPGGKTFHGHDRV